MTLEDELFDDKVSLVESIKPDDWLTPIEVAELFRVTARTVTRWLDRPGFSWVKTFKTPGGHRRYYRPDVMKALENYEDKQTSTQP